MPADSIAAASCCVLAVVRRSSRALLVLVLLMSAMTGVSAATVTWDGGSTGPGDDNWTTAANWVGDVAPVAGDSLVFAGSVRLTATNDFAADTSFASITFDNTAGAFTLSGNRLTLAGAITNNDADAQTISLALVVAATRTLAAASGNLTLSGVISGAGGLSKSGSNTLTLAAANSYAGTTTISAGTLRIGASGGLPSSNPIALAGTAVLDLNGFDTTVTNVSSSVVGATIIDNSAVAGTTTFTVSAQVNVIACLVKDGATRQLAVAVANSFSNNSIFTVTNQNTFSGGLTLLHNAAAGTFLTLTSALSTTGTAGNITSGPYGRGAITVGQNAASRAQPYLFSGALTIVNDIIWNTSLGTNVPGLRCDTTGIVLSGTITANLATLNFTNDFSVATVTVSGRITGPQGVTLQPSSGSGLTVTLSNGSNDYAGATQVNTGTLLVTGATPPPAP